ncbi:MAG: DsbA family protein [Bryobacteraceae bacterium]
MKRIAVALACLAGLSAGATPPGKGKAVGSASAPITIEVFSDFECPACKGLHDEGLRMLVKDYVVTGKVYLIYRDFPLPMHKYSRLAASYACAAARIGRYAEVADALFMNQLTWSVDGRVEQTVVKALTPTEAAEVRKLFTDPGITAEIQHDIELGKAAGINQTPTLIVRHNGVPYPLPGGNVNYDLLRGFLDHMLAK